MFTSSRVTLAAGGAGTLGAISALATGVSDPGRTDITHTDSIVVKNTGTVEALIGHATLTAANGFRLAVGQTLELRLVVGESVHGAVVGTTAGALDILANDA